MRWFSRSLLWITLETMCLLIFLASGIAAQTANMAQFTLIYVFIAALALLYIAKFFSALSTFHRSKSAPTVLAVTPVISAVITYGAFTYAPYVLDWLVAACMIVLFIAALIMAAIFLLTKPVARKRPEETGA